jgi:hypothetical protein
MVSASDALLLPKQDTSLRHDRRGVKRPFLRRRRKEPLVRNKHFLDFDMLSERHSLDLNQRWEQTHDDVLLRRLVRLEWNPEHVFRRHPGLVIPCPRKAEVYAVVLGAEEERVLELECVFEPLVRVVSWVAAGGVGTADAKGPQEFVPKRGDLLFEPVVLELVGFVVEH